MKKSLWLVLTAAALFSFSGCELLSAMMESSGGSSEEERGYEMVTATKTIKWDVNQSPICEIDPDVKTVNVSNVPAGKSMYLVHRNARVPGKIGVNVDISFNDMKTIVSGVTGRSAAAESVKAVEIEAPVISGGHFTAPVIPIPAPSAARAATTAGSAPVTQITPVVGTTEKTVYIDCNNDMTQYKAAKAVLRAKGDYCYIWVVDGYYTTGTAEGQKVNETICRNFALKFDSMYDSIRTVFGKESEKIFNYDTLKLEAISDRSDTGSMVNIVIYDIGADYGQTKETGVFGYFYSKDYSYSSATQNSIIDKSNVGKYFYVDAHYSIVSENHIISTLAHEFQHMINYNQKNVINYVAPTTGYNEMLSMLCEDLMQKKLDLSDSESPKGRMLNFNAYYYLAAISGYRNTEASLYYSTNYAFGSWVARQYGGAALVKAMSTNKYVDADSIVNAVNSVNNKTYTYEDLFQQFLLALTGSSTYTHNKNAAQTVEYDGYKYPMTAFDIFGNGYQPSMMKGFEDGMTTYAWSQYKWNGPFIFNINYSVKYLKDDNGIVIQGVEKTTSGSKTITFSESAPAIEKLYLIIQ